MFRRLEGYTNGQQWSAFQKEMTANTLSPLVVSNKPPPADINRIASGLNPKSQIDVYTAANNYARTLQELNKRNKVCMGYDTIEKVKNLNQKGAIQCAWYFNENSGGVSKGKGYLSTQDGPIPGLDAPIPSEDNTMYFGNSQDGFRNYEGFASLEQGKEDIDIANCNKILMCSQVGSSGPFPDCGFCEDTNTGVPVDAYGNTLYSSATCTSSPITNPTSCAPPKNDALITQYQEQNIPKDSNGAPKGIIYPAGSAAAQAVSCQPDKNGRLSGICLQAALETRGCTSDGSLSLALNGFQSSYDPESIVRNSPTIADYVARKPNFNLNQFLTASTMQFADDNAKVLALSSQAANEAAKQNPNRQSRANTLAIDLCTKAGYFKDNYNFCNELNDRTPVPTMGWDMRCLEEEFLRPVNGIKLRQEGRLFPNSTNAATYNTLSNWAQVKKFIQDIRNNIYQSTSSGTLSTGALSISALPPKQLLNVKKIVEKFTSGATSQPSMLISNNGYYITYVAPNNPVELKPYTGATNQLFKWELGPASSLWLIPVANPKTILRHLDGILRSDIRPDTLDIRLTGDASFYWIGESDTSSKFRFLSQNVEENYLRKSGSIITLEKGGGDESIFVIQDGQTTDLTNYNNYEKQFNGFGAGLGYQIDQPRPPPTSQGMEVYQCKYRNAGILVITNYSVMDTIPPLTGAGLHALFTIGNYTVDKTINVTPTLTLGNGDAAAIAVNGYLTGWGWQSNNLIDAPLNTFPPLPIIKKYSTKTKNLRIGGQKNGFNRATGPYELKGSGIPNIIKTQWWWGGGGIFNYTLNPPPISVSILRDINAPFLRFEPQFDKWFGDVRFFDIANNPKNYFVELGAGITYRTTSDDKLQNPGSNGYISLTFDHIFINYVDNPIWNIATFVFSVDFTSPMLSTQTLLYFGNARQPNPTRWWETTYSNGFKLVALPTSTGSYEVTVQSMLANNTIAKVSSSKLTLSKTAWHMAVINKLDNIITIYALTGTAPSYTISKVGDIPIPSYTIYPYTYSDKDNNTLPRITIGEYPLKISINVVFLHLFDTTITSVNPQKELIGYGSGGYTTGLF